MFRENSQNHLHRCRELFQQYVVDQWAKVESERLNFVRMQQSKLRQDKYVRVIHAEDGDLRNIGKKVVLPSTFVGGPRYMWKKQQDAMTYVRKHGHPDLFITFTCNPRWEEIVRELLPGQDPVDRPDLVDRVFKLKLNQLVQLLTKGELFGPHEAFMYSVEFQKRGLPHAHLLLWLKNKLRPSDIDKIIRAEIPNELTDPELFKIVTEQMVHGPCGARNMNSPCMKDKRCSKKYPKEMLQSTRSDLDGYPQYRRRTIDDGGHEAVIWRGGAPADIDNSWIVPYNPVLLRIFKAHINVELCNSVKAIKYVCKYICKGQDMLSFQLKPQNSQDETEIYQLARYISAPEAVWRLFCYDVHEHSPGVETLAVHLEDQKVIRFDPAIETSESVKNREEEKESTLEGFFTLCREDPEGTKDLMYADVPEHYRWVDKKWVKRKTKEKKLGRVYPVHPSQMEAFCLRLLLFTVPGPKSYENLRTVEIDNLNEDGSRLVERVICGSFQEACKELGLLEDDQQYNEAMNEAYFSGSPKKLRDLFCYIITACPDVSDRLTLWNNHKDSMSEDLLYEERKTNPTAEEKDVHNQCLMLIEDKILQIAGKDLSQFPGLPVPNRNVRRLTVEEKRETYVIQDLENFISENEDKLTDEQQMVHDIILANLNQGGFWFLDAPGGTGKTFVTKLILAQVRSSGATALAVASSGIGKKN